ncbi:hypothetical protein SDC9_115967 [bioreactor metagenome]|uniref:Uncharacterized protein n=1 Tax=bioreactor metagenome TaxID=1076179 RepID=A0A645C112_9ZZZZ
MSVDVYQPHAVMSDIGSLHQPRDPGIGEVMAAAEDYRQSAAGRYFSDRLGLRLMDLFKCEVLCPYVADVGDPQTVKIRAESGRQPIEPASDIVGAVRGSRASLVSRYPAVLGDADDRDGPLFHFLDVYARHQFAEPAVLGVVPAVKKISGRRIYFVSHSVFLLKWVVQSLDFIPGGLGTQGAA